MKAISLCFSFGLTFDQTACVINDFTNNELTPRGIPHYSVVKDIFEFHEYETIEDVNQYLDDIGINLHFGPAKKQQREAS